ncbi:MAG TPA: 1-deoxy-D-xylulose-5-phosphate synthase [Bacteroidales bacterium]|jgi:1-deoxy-D-xylulose-5-phosphate synthase|nr:1-deoxy-D-xylulose-5-phosphate synthase [Bacteroidales bacterium]MDI9574294.1 1-deoxy-D-xylulose-5-phosphate synthase [Bacteroidota bacterium]OQC59130.1 MAG: 1-deoxy-D-xylulose-5-phosphate synthase [Bacteroidetes bacterium ADurb.Bin012]MBP9512307.1 1-deoxy-D-xylulose-5-phosphate synthase [Bacteroidales bacterium]MBP9588830.1 1-deoxy-D-xylulose-5-phosphate synthase [Bacteroidales bacterium]
MEYSIGPHLAKINSPEELRMLPEDKLPELCQEIRDYIIEVMSSNPGHLAASLGAVELAVAIHYVFNTPSDKLIWDVGHQAYAHKIITGRRDQFPNNRTYGGISGFPRMEESEYDAFGTGHSSTSISAALGMAIAAKLRGDARLQHIAVIGDGAMTAGMAFEAMNHAGSTRANILIILNDNGIAIDRNIGALKEYLAQFTASQTYNKFRNRIWNLLGGDSKYGTNTRHIVKQVGNALKSSLLNRSNLFEAMGFRYFGPVDGHDVVKLSHLLHDLKNIPGPKLLHVITKKGKGLEKAELDPTTYHSPGTFNKETGELDKSSCEEKLPPKYQNVFGKTIIELARNNPRIVGITPAMSTGCSLNLMMEVMPERTFDVGIAEQHAVTFSAGLAAAGMIPFCNIYSSFMQRAFDQAIHDVCLQKLHVVFCLDRAGIVGEDGATHHGAFDLAYFRTIPNLIVSAPLNEKELRNMMYTAQLNGIGPFSIRYPRGRGVLNEWRTPFEAIPIGKGQKLKDGTHLAVLSIGHIGNIASEAIAMLQNEGIDCAHYDMRFLKPIDEDLLHEVFTKFKKVITIEDGTVVGGLGSAVLEFMNDYGYKAQLKRLGIPDRFISHGTIEQLQKECGYDKEGIIKAVKEMM